MKQLKDGYRISATPDNDFAPEHGGVMVMVIVERRAALVKFDNGDIYDAPVWVEVYDILSEVNDPDDAEELQAVMEYNYPHAFH